MPLNNENNNDCCKCTTPEYIIELNAQGPQGRQGEQGLPGFSPKVSVATNNYSTYKLNITTEEGSFTTPNLKSPLPSGGNANNLLIKNSSTDGDISWANANAIPNIVTTDENYQQITGVKYFYNNDGLLYAKPSDAPGVYGLSGLTAYMNPNTGRTQAGSALSYLKSHLETHLILHGAGPETSEHTPVRYQRINTNDASANQYFVMMDNANLKDYLVAGDNITLTPDSSGKITIASSGGTTGDYVTLDGDDIIGGYKTFSNSISIGNEFGETPEMYGTCNYGKNYIACYAGTNSTSFRIESGTNQHTPEDGMNLDIGRTDFTEWNVVNVGAKSFTFNNNPVLTSANISSYLPSDIITSTNISQDEYIASLEARIAALEALIDGGNANSVSTLIAQSSKTEAINSVENNGNVGIDNITTQDGE